MEQPRARGIIWIYYFGLALMIASIPLSRYFMSVSQFILTGVFLWEGVDQQLIKKDFRDHKGAGKLLWAVFRALSEVSKNFISKFTVFFHNRNALIITSIFFLHIAGLIYSQNLHNGFVDLRNKLPLFLLPLFLSTSPKLSKRTFDLLLLIFIFAVFAGTLFSIYIDFSQRIADTREISIFISHIRFSLNICLAVFVIFYFIFFNKSYHIKYRLMLIPVMSWMIIFLFILKSMTGIIAFFITGFILLLIYSLRQRRIIVKYSLISVLVIIPLIIVMYALSVIRQYQKVEQPDWSTIGMFSPAGNPYIHDTVMGIEEGKYVGLYICYPELIEAWNSRSAIHFDSIDHKNQEIRYTIIRYMTSKRLRKDSEGIDKLSDQDIINIENGIANVNYLKKFSIRNKINESLLAWSEYKEKGNFRGYSAMERIELIKAASDIISRNWLIGVGTGDLKDQFRLVFIEADSPLRNAKEGMFSSHNQFFNITVMFGFLGLLWFLLALLYPAIREKKFHHFLFISFFIIAIVSFLTDDTLKTQAGVTFFSFFYSFLLFSTNFSLSKPKSFNEKN